MNRITYQELLRIKSQELGLDPDRFPLPSTEGLACALRRAAGYLSPCSAATLIRAVVVPLEGLVPDMQATRDKVDEVLEALVAHGDLLEQKDIVEAAGGPLLYAAPPSFIVRQSGSVLILGITPDHRTPLPSELEEQIEYVAHVRRLPTTLSISIREVLRQFGLVELTIDYWLKSPPVMSAQRHLANANELLSKAQSFHSEVPGLTILDPDQPVRYYRGRWTEPKRHTGRYVGRREQAYGAELWCYVELVNGKPQRFVDLPFGTNRYRGCDAAWHLQMAIDAVSGHPQIFSVVAEDEDKHILKCFSPAPQWVRRRLNAAGALVEIKGCLFAYALSTKEVDEERTFLRQSLWLSEDIRKQD